MNKALIVTAISLAASTFAAAQSVTEENARRIIAPFYANFTMPVKGNAKSLLEHSTTVDWQSCSGTDVKQCRGREMSAKVFTGFGQAIPDMKHEVKEVIVARDKIVVRGDLTGTPAGEFFGVPQTGRSFKIMAIDVHTIKSGKIAHTYHVEDWASALTQLRAK